MIYIHTHTYILEFPYAPLRDFDGREALLKVNSVSCAFLFDLRVESLVETSA